MKIAIVVASEAFLDSAGVRIRYTRFREAMGEDGDEWSFVTLDALRTVKAFPADAYVFVKTFTPAALILMARVSALGKLVAQDLFDDYFSQHGDVRLARFRLWLMQAAQFTDLAICTTLRMQAVLRSFLPATPVVVVDDPIDLPDTAALGAVAYDKLARMRVTRRLRILWFGIGDNPYFPVGLQDLVARADDLVRLDRAGWAVEVCVLTNDRALDAAMLARLRRFPLPLDLRQWSVAAEAEALAAADIVFLPVAAQPFSMAKSLNRALAALSHGCQIFSPAFPLYARLGPLVYRDADNLATDLGRGRLRIDATAIERGRDGLVRLSGDRPLAEAFVAALRTTPGARAAGRQLCVLHGGGSTVAEHKLAVASGGLSIGTPFHLQRLNYDIRIEIDGDRLVTLVQQRLLPHIDTAIPAPGPTRRIFDHDFVAIEPDPASDPLNIHLPLRSASSRHAGSRAVAYPPVMDYARRDVARLFPQAAMIVSDNGILLHAAQARWNRSRWGNDHSLEAIAVPG